MSCPVDRSYTALTDGAVPASVTKFPIKTGQKLGSGDPETTCLNPPQRGQRNSCPSSTLIGISVRRRRPHTHTDGQRERERNAHDSLDLLALFRIVYQAAGSPQQSTPVETPSKPKPTRWSLRALPPLQIGRPPRYRSSDPGHRRQPHRNRFVK